MPDREKVIEHITDCVKIADCQINHNWVFVRTDILRDALELLKAQEAVVMVGAELTDTELIEGIRKASIVLKPNVDAVPVVRCRDCKWFDCKNYVCYNDILAGRIADCGCYPNFNVESDWFCADGERRESE